MKSFNLSRSPEPEDNSNETKKKCPECKSDIPKDATKCAQCGSKQKKQYGAISLILWGAVIVMLVFVFTGGDSNTSSTTQQPEITESKVHITAQDYVERVLKSPSTADFPTFDYNYFDLGNKKYKIVSYVDSQNSFGAMVRSNYSVILSYNSGNWANVNNWTLHELIFDGEILYSE